MPSKFPACGRSQTSLYNAARMHLSVNKDAPSPRTVHAVGRIVSTPFLADSIICMVRQEKPDASSGRNSRPGKGNEPPHRESSLGLMEATTGVKRRHERRA